MKNLIWITGKKSFIGKNLIKRFKKENINFIATSKNDLNLLNSSEIKKFLIANNPTTVIQTAGKVGGIEKNIKNKIELLQENLLISFNLIKYCYEFNISKFINPVSSCIYPKNIRKRQKESDVNIRKTEDTNEAYSLSKFASYKLIDYYFHNKKINYINLIPSNIYGPHDNFNKKNGHVIPVLINKFLEKKNVQLLGSGIARRDFLFIDDFISAIIILIKQNNFKQSTYNVSSSEIISIKNLVKIISKLTNNYQYSFLNNNLDGNLYKSLDSKNISKMGWSEKFDLKKGITETIRWYTKNYK